MNSCLRLLITRVILGAICCCLPPAVSSVTAQQPPPAISHTPIKSAPRGKPLNIISQIDGRGKEVASANLHFRQSINAAPVSVPMQKTSVGTWFGTIPSSYLNNKGIIQYYIDAANSAGEWTETNYHTISIIDPHASPAPVPPEQVGPLRGSEPNAKKDRAWLWPTVLIGGGALAVAGVVALADSGGSSSSNNNSGDSGGDTGGGTPIPITDRVITRTASDTSSTVGSFPSVSIIDATDAVGLGKISQVRVDLNVNPLDGFEEQFQVLYEGKTIIDTGVVFIGDARTITVQGSSPIVTVQVVSSRADDFGANNYTWNATATFFLAE